MTDQLLAEACSLLGEINARLGGPRPRDAAEMLPWLQGSTSGSGSARADEETVEEQAAAISASLSPRR